ncbi:MAG: class I SAM-dependent methyltransferase, partial [Microscillaceae bacterium]|nr:class I SAM-dependent methyltransferase [Microscillaceae bacterium]
MPLGFVGRAGDRFLFFAQKMQAVVHVEPDESLQAIVRYNFAQLGQEKVRFVNQTAEAFLESSALSPDWIYLDPSRRPDAHKRAYRLEDCQPNVLALQDQLLGLGPQILLKAAPWLDIQEALQKLKNVWQVWIVALENEVKELLFAFGKGRGEGEPMLEAVNLRPEGPETFSFSRTEEKQHQAETGPLQSFLIEPNRAILKAGAFHTFACRFGLRKLHPHTHLYTTEALPALPLPGRVFGYWPIVPIKKGRAGFLPEKRPHS